MSGVEDQHDVCKDNHDDQHQGGDSERLFLLLVLENLGKRACEYEIQYIPLSLAGMLRLIPLPVSYELHFQSKALHEGALLNWPILVGTWQFFGQKGTTRGVFNGLTIRGQWSWDGSLICEARYTNYLRLFEVPRKRPLFCKPLSIGNPQLRRSRGLRLLLYRHHCPL